MERAPLPPGLVGLKCLFALAWPWQGDISCWTVGLLTQHPASSTFFPADVFPSTWVSPGFLQGLLTMGPDPPVPSQQYPEDHRLQKPCLVCLQLPPPPTVPSREPRARQCLWAGAVDLLPTHRPVRLRLPQQTDFSDFLGCSVFSAPEL